ncbi:U8 snoRNA-decapping enzyme-like [Planococcus citri]|uniref:U8 snoRNA-decapping enzyme-like n=1 Tax=Planococcus citri TaxID=170843 RepID=UPI0031F9BD1F
MDNSKTGDLTWGHLEDTEVFGRRAVEDDYIVVDKETASKKYQIDAEASHCIIYAKSDRMIFDVYCCRAVILMHMRFDGYIGFPGGLVDPGEDDVASLNRELIEELNLDLSKHRVEPKDHIISHYNTKNKLLLHFYGLEINLKDMEELERRALQAKDHGSEVLGNIRVPLYTMGDGVRGFPVFLRNQFIGNARQQLLYTLEKYGIMKKDEIERALHAF